MATIDVKKVLKVKVKIGNDVLLTGVEDMFNDMLEDGMDVAEALDTIVYDGVLRYILNTKFPKYLPTSTAEYEDGEFDVELERIPEL